MIGFTSGWGSAGVAGTGGAEELVPQAASMHPRAVRIRINLCISRAPSCNPRLLEQVANGSDNSRKLKLIAQAEQPPGV